MKQRYLHLFILNDLKEKMVFVGGPRQVGKTTLAKFIGEKDYQHKMYLNWDFREDRKIILNGEFEADSQLLIFDEIHKYKQWKNYIKGEFDKYKDRFDIIVTGSARLDTYRKGGDSLMGRYHYYKLHPFSLAESLWKTEVPVVFKELSFKTDKNTKKIFDQLFKFGGFPEPFLKQDEKTLRRWQNERLDRFIKEDIRDIESLRDLSALHVLVEMIPGRVGSLLSLNSLREDLGVAHKTISLWMGVLEKFYYHFRIYPYTNSRIKSLKKEPKLFLWDWSEIKNENARLENLVGSHLLKFCHFLQDAEGYKAELSFLRDIEGREVDFFVTIDQKPWFAVEVKNKDKSPSKHLKYFGDKLNIPFMYQVVNLKNVDFLQENIRIIGVDKFLSGLV